MSRLRFGTASRTAAGHQVCGDVSVIIPCGGGSLICLADGLGHGPSARTAGEAVCQYARAHATESLERMMQGMDAALSTTRGAAASVLVLLPAERRGLFAGVGNVELRALSRERVAPPTMPGIVGRGVRKVRVWEFAVSEGDLLVLLSDGISSRFELGELAHLEPQVLADTLVARHHKSHDDGSVVVARVGR